MRLLKRILLLLVVLILLALLALWLTLHRSLPRLDGELQLPGLSAPAQIERDALGTATVRAQNRRDVSFALGFVHAQERFFQMDLMRRSAAGELAALVGAAALPLDRLRRPHRLRARFAEGVAKADPAEHDLLASYRDGVNAGLAQLDARPWEYLLLGQTPAPWRDEDSALIIGAMYFDLNDGGNTRELAFAKIHAALPPSVYKFLSASGGAADAPLLGLPLRSPTVPPASDLDLRKLDPALSRVPADAAEPHTIPGSNSFGVAGALTQSGAALIANDMHLGLRVPGLWFRARLTYPNPRHRGEDVDISGVSLPGTPGIVVGSNRHVAWAFTNSYGDWADWVRITLDPADPTHYHTADGWDSIKTFPEIIKVHGGSDEKLDVRETRWGPILGADADGTPLALAWIAAQPGGANLEQMKMELADTADEIVDIANRSGMPPQNIIVGDRAGNLEWSIAGRIPQRTGDYDPMLPSDWSRPNTGWNGWLDPNLYPRIANPNSHRLWTANSRVVDDEWLKLIGDSGYDFGARTSQIRDDLKAKEKFTAADMLEIQLDDRALFMAQWKGVLEKTLGNPGNDPALVAMKTQLANWSGHADTASVSYRLVRDFRREVVDTVLDGFAAAVRAKFADFKLPKIGQSETLVQAIVAQRAPHLLPPGYASWDDLLLKCATRVAHYLDKQPGGIAARSWGEFNQSDIHHPLENALPLIGRWLSMPREGLPGDSFMPRVQGTDFGASERLAVEPGHEDQGYLELAGGQSDHPLSPFFGAGHADWMQGKPTPFLPGATKYTLRLSPQSR